ncbi:hypothetical protein ACHAXR_010451 [Thalassiosira sp. AJA248-18]
MSREEASGDGWQEHFVDEARASDAASVGLAIAQSFSYITIDHFASPAERTALLLSAQSTSSAGPDGASDGANSSSHVMFASGINVGCSRYSVETLLDAKAKATSATFLDRLLGFLDGSRGEDDGEGCNDPDFTSGGYGGERMADLAEQVFGQRLDLRTMDAVWYSEPDEDGRFHPEPKVNLYSEGGYFAQHGDGMDLTLLVVLTDSFEGGGTAFFRDLGLDQSDLDLVGYDNDGEARTMSNEWHTMKPESVAKPPAGTAMIWGGTLQHMALPVTLGSRAVYVGSFDLKKCNVDL